VAHQRKKKKLKCALFKLEMEENVKRSGGISRSLLKNLPLLVQARVGTAPKITPKQFLVMFEAHQSDWEILLPKEEDIGKEDEARVCDVQVETPYQRIYREIEEKTGEILKAGSGFAELAFNAEIPTFEELCSEFEGLRELYFKAVEPRKQQQSIRLINGISDAMLRNHMKQVEAEKGVDLISVHSDVVVRVALFDCRTRMQSQEFLVLGSQMLTDLKDAINCLGEKVYGTPSSSYFLIEDTFYDDLRFEGSIRYSDVIVEWVRHKKRYTHPGLTRFMQKEMHNQCIGDLSIRLNSFYYYVHHGDCTHVLVFKEIRMLGSHDCLNRKAYPLLIYQPRIKIRKCGVCDIYAAKHVTYGDKLAPENPFFFCDACYHQLHYDNDGNLIYDDFQVFPYYNEA
jgi:hypothetical protein